MVDPLADGIIGPAVRLAGGGEIVAAEIQALGDHEVRRRHRRGEFRHHRLRRRRGGVALAHHHPADIVDHRRPVLVGAGRAHPDHARGGAGVLLQPDHRAGGAQRVARPDRRQPAALGVAKIGDGIERDVGHGLAEDGMEGDEVVKRGRRQAAGAGKFIRGEKRVAGGIKRVIERALAARQGARHRMGDDLAQRIILEEAADAGLHQ